MVGRAESRKGFVLKLRHSDFILEDLGSHWAVEQQDDPLKSYSSLQEKRQEAATQTGDH